MTKIFEKPTSIRQVLTCKSKWTKKTSHKNLLKDDPELPRHLMFEKHCLHGALWCKVEKPTKQYIVVKEVIDKLCEQNKLPLKWYKNVLDFNDHPTTEWKHIQLVLRNLPKGI